MSKKTICMYGAASDSIDAVYFTETRKLGEEIAKRGHTLIYGAGASGLMGACSYGVLEAGGKVIGVAPRFIREFEALNEDCTELIHTETMGERKEIMEREADAFVIVPGGIGTFDEFFQILTLVDLGRKDAPIVLYNIDGFYDDLLKFMNSCMEKGFIRAHAGTIYTVKNTAKEVLDAIEG